MSHFVGQVYMAGMAGGFTGAMIYGIECHLRKETLGCRRHMLTGLIAGAAIAALAMILVANSPGAIIGATIALLIFTLDKRFIETKEQFAFVVNAMLIGRFVGQFF